MKEVWVGYNVGCTVGFHLGHSAWQIDQFPTCWPMNGLFVHWSRGWGVSSFSERLVYPYPGCLHWQWGYCLIFGTEYPMNYSHSCVLCCFVLFWYDYRSTLWIYVNYSSILFRVASLAWWRHQMETFSLLLVLCEGNPLVTSGFPSERPVMQSFEVCFDLCLNKQLSKQSRCRQLQTPSHSLWRHYNGHWEIVWLLQCQLGNPK